MYSAYLVLGAWTGDKITFKHFLQVVHHRRRGALPVGPIPHRESIVIPAKSIHASQVRRPNRSVWIWRCSYQAALPLPLQLAPTAIPLPEPPPLLPSP